VIPPIVEDTIIYSSVLVLLSLGLTLTYMTTKVPNLAHATISIVGSYVTLTVLVLSLISLAREALISQADSQSFYRLIKSFSFTPLHYALFMALGFLLGSVIGVAQYKLVLKPLSQRGAKVVQLMIATIAVDMFLLSMLNIYADKLLEYVVSKANELSSIAGFKVSLGVQTRDFILYSYDYSKTLGTQRLVMIAPVMAVALLVALSFVLYRTKLGVALRASIENPSLASTLGVNVDKMYTLAWVLSLGLAGLAGSLIPLKYLVNPSTGQLFVLSIFAASILGGLNSLAGAVIGGVLIACFEIPVFNYLSSHLGISSAYRTVIPLLAMALTLLFIPRGVAGLNWKKLFSRVRR
jgi:branched-chain amino acid transport system permease protein